MGEEDQRHRAQKWHSVWKFCCLSRCLEYTGALRSQIYRRILAMGWQSFINAAIMIAPQRKTQKLIFLSEAHKKILAGEVIFQSPKWYLNLYLIIHSLWKHAIFCLVINQWMRNSLQYVKVNCIYHPLIYHLGIKDIYIHITPYHFVTSCGVWSHQGSCWESKSGGH